MNNGSIEKHERDNGAIQNKEVMAKGRAKGEIAGNGHRMRPASQTLGEHVHLPMKDHRTSGGEHPDLTSTRPIRTSSFAAFAGMFFAALTIAHVDFYIYGLDLPWYVLLNGIRLILACLLAWGLMTVLFHFRK
jgi:hypothetical protein